MWKVCLNLVRDTLTYIIVICFQYLLTGMTSELCGTFTIIINFFELNAYFVDVDSEMHIQIAV